MVLKADQGMDQRVLRRLHGMQAAIIEVCSRVLSRCKTLVYGESMSRYAQVRVVGISYRLLPPPDFFKSTVAISRPTHERAKACRAHVTCRARSARARARTHALLARACTPSVREGRSPLPPCAAPTPILTVRAIRPQAFPCVIGCLDWAFGEEGNHMCA